ncbi:MAG: hypothetical protein A3G32_01760 [Deltaproteobacteria bacterium RIFCSPLOWO2_12_FULL_40_28]|nr:MAG: hypothetical protein A3C45_06505 [Deltaproteobacteria bacterium RIFCSPHIGHO2_02_FULL_40_28]OGQ18858.1 MAG: hypothetical protein A3E27_09140 [Deltaproteobacteria bacterium RIFCSPHIGHO2_12_FULL_40_32]OGQ40103.1 MAG: hypothetical protein A3I69_01670 [Deltaproteobacteria bacterium RIFCSPLOWO2_02_FULL_40_36]OGQ53286.1 MAG: hypothetical protein A3G32_01760 [Deltaproteobacteria bacterium RIFCSPLOWO2_12_FULL_40_28]
MNSIITTITLLPVLDKKIRELAKKKGQTKTSLIQEAISNYLERIEILEIEKKLQAKGRQLGLTSEEDVVHMVKQFRKERC